MTKQKASVHCGADMTPVLCFSKVIMIHYIVLMLTLDVHIWSSLFHGLKYMTTIVGNKINDLK